MAKKNQGVDETPACSCSTAARRSTPATPTCRRTRTRGRRRFDGTKVTVNRDGVFTDDGHHVDV